jgi:hypothetical protein
MSLWSTVGAKIQANASGGVNTKRRKPGAWSDVDVTKRADHRKGMGGSSLNILSHSSRHSLQIRASLADAMAAT